MSLTESNKATTPSIKRRNFSHALDRIVGSFLTFLCNDTDIILLLCNEVYYITGKLFLLSKPVCLLYHCWVLKFSNCMIHEII